MRLFLIVSALLCLAACGQASYQAAPDEQVASAEAAAPEAADEAYAETVDNAYADAAEASDSATYAAADGPGDPLPTATPSAQLPSFRLPAPKPSARANLPRSLFGQPATVGDIAARLERALDTSGYEDFSYFRVPGGFALVTQTERIHDDGKPYAGTARWQFQPTSLVNVDALFNSGFPGSFLERLRTADPGRYRALVFLATTNAVTSGPNPPTVQTVQAWTAGGADHLPAAIRRIALTEDHNISLLIYEFRRASVSAAPQFIDPSGLTARRHMQATSLLRGGQ
jgi:hypothetical protein